MKTLKLLIILLSIFSYTFANQNIKTNLSNKLTMEDIINGKTLKKEEKEEKNYIVKIL